MAGRHPRAHRGEGGEHGLDAREEAAAVLDGLGGGEEVDLDDAFQVDALVVLAVAIAAVLHEQLLGQFLDRLVEQLAGALEYLGRRGRRGELVPEPAIRDLCAEGESPISQRRLDGRDTCGVDYHRSGRGDGLGKGGGSEESEENRKLHAKGEVVGFRLHSAVLVGFVGSKIPAVINTPATVVLRTAQDDAMGGVEWFESSY